MNSINANGKSPPFTMQYRAQMLGIMSAGYQPDSYDVGQREAAYQNVSQVWHAPLAAYPTQERSLVGAQSRAVAWDAVTAGVLLGAMGLSLLNGSQLALLATRLLLLALPLAASLAVQAHRALRVCLAALRAPLELASAQVREPRQPRPVASTSALAFTTFGSSGSPGVSVVACGDPPALVGGVGNELRVQLREALNGLAAPWEPTQVRAGIARAFDLRWIDQVHRASDGLLPARIETRAEAMIQLSAVVAYRGYLHIANLGGGRVVACKPHGVQRLSVSHVASERSEQAVLAHAHPLLRGAGMSRGMVVNGAWVSPAAPSAAQVASVPIRGVQGAILAILSPALAAVLSDEEVRDCTEVLRSGGTAQQAQERLAALARSRGATEGLRAACFTPRELAAGRGGRT